MVNSILLGFKGPGAWLWQRVSAVILTAYVCFLAGYVLLHPHLDFSMWQNLFSATGMRIFTVIALLSLAIHAWVGIWTVLTDYINCITLRLFLQVAVIVALFMYMIWGIQILWSV